MKISHEVPLCLLKHSLTFNDYQFCLPHLLDENEEYRDHFLKYKNERGYIIMDNSLHELGEAYDRNRLLYWVNNLRPNEFVVPDVWEDKTLSVVNAREWSKIEFPEEVEKIAVVQGKDLLEMMTCIQTYKDLGYKKFAFSYGASLYNNLFPHPNKDLGKALGRIYVISTLYDKGIIHPNDRVHLLGTALPQEFGWYKGIDFIESIDTSNPIMAALDGVKYSPFGLKQKPKSNLNNSFDMLNCLIPMDILEHNVKMFREFTK